MSVRPPSIKHARIFKVAIIASLLAAALLAPTACRRTTRQMRFAKPLVFRISGSSTPARQYAGVIQNYLEQVGIPVDIQPSEFNTMLDQLRYGQFQMAYGQWVGGNQDPIFYKDLFASSEIPTQTRAARNRSRYENPELDQILEAAVNTYDHDKAQPLYARAQEIVSRDVPLLPLWYQANMVVAKKTVGNIQVNASGDWGFVKDLTIEGNRAVIALSDNIKTIDPIGSPTVDAASERVRSLIFNSLVKKDEKFDYVGELASNIQRSDDGLTFIFTLRDGVMFQDGRPFTSADAKYTLDTILNSTFAKAASFFEGAGADRRSYVNSVTAPDAHTLVIRLNKQWTGLLSNLVPIAIIPKDSYESEKTHPLGTGPFKFVSYDSAQQVVDLEAFPNYYDGPTHVASLRVRVISDANAMQAELRSGRVDIAPLPTSLSPDAIHALGKDPNLKVEQFPGSNLNQLTFNTREPPLDNVKVRQAIAYAIDRDSMIKALLLGQGKIANSILPEESWAYTPGTIYRYDQAKANQLLDEAGFPAGGGK
ncbi:MAG TPA: ABC transporter substrate-binding protein [Pyrinomonadaceae bacterium]|jgi:ABC-type transport system substrate-binding protein|nr:ABC transporter substrate-binding protein [Pyrinomonadaceae bacterium]